MLTAILLALQPYIVEIIVLAFSVYLMPKVYDFLKLSADDKRRAYLQDALYNGVLFGVNSVISQGVDVASLDAAKADLVTFAKSYVVTAVPDALKDLDISDDQLVKLIEARLPEIILSVQAAVTPSAT